MNNNSNAVAQPLLSRSMFAVMFAQFFSAFGDNALLFATLALIKQHLYPEWSQPVLQMAFVATYIVCAPFVGQLADAFPKGRVMMFSNGMKLLGALAICLGFNPFIGYAIVGVGAASYSPAKYGILGEITEGDQLVKANGLIEASTIAAILGGSLTGGFLADWNLFALFGMTGGLAEIPAYLISLGVCAAVYGLAVIANLYIPKLKPARTDAKWQVGQMLSKFVHSCRVLFSDTQTRFSLIGTSIFWGAGVTLRFLLVLWVPVALNIVDNTTPTRLNAVVAIGIVIGAAMAAKMITLKTVIRCIPAGVLMGIVVICFTLQESINTSYILLIVIGVLGGFFVVPLNALLQDGGKRTVGAGNAIAVQNLCENTAMLVMLGLFSLAVEAGVNIKAIGVGFGVLFAIMISLLWIWQRKINRRC